MEDLTSEPQEAEAVDVVEAPHAPAVARVQTVEEWATEKKLLPQFFPPPNFRAPGGAGQGGIARIAMSGLSGPVPNREHWKFAAARIGELWPEGKEMTEADFDAAVAKHTTHVCR